METAIWTPETSAPAQQARQGGAWAEEDADDQGATAAHRALRGDHLPQGGLHWHKRKIASMLEDVALMRQKEQ